MKNDNKWTWFVLLVIFVTGTFLLLITPMGANYDEETHLARIWEMSLGHMLPNSLYHKTDIFPSVFFDSSFRRFVNLPVIDLAAWKEQASLHIDFNNYMKYTTRAVYFPTIYALQAVLIGITGRLFDFPVLVIYYILRLSYLLIYCIFVYLTLRVLPTGKRLFGVIAIAPAAIIQSAAISADAFVFGVSFLFTGWMLHLLAEPSKTLSRRQLVITMVLILAVGTLKPNSIFLLLLLILLPFSLRLTKGQKWALVITALVSTAISAGWSLVASQYFLARDDAGKDPIAQFLFILKDPLGFLGVFFTSLKTGWYSLMMQSIGVTGYGYYTLPKAIYILYPVLLLLGIVAEDSEFKFNWRQNIILAAIAFFNVFMIYVILFIVETRVTEETINGIQGRYITPLFLLFFSSLLFLPRLKLQLGKTLITAGMVLLSLFTAASIYADYHIPCGNYLFSKENCVMPRYKNWAEESFVTYTPTSSTRIDEVITVKCNDLNAVRFWVARNPEDENYKYTLSLVNSHGKLVLVMDSTGDETVSHGWMTFPFSPIKGIYGEQFFVELSSNAVDATGGVSFGAFEKDEFTDGYLQVNGNSEGYAPDLVIQYGCEKLNR